MKKLIEMQPLNPVCSSASAHPRCDQPSPEIAGGADTGEILPPDLETPADTSWICRVEMQAYGKQTKRLGIIIARFGDGKTWKVRFLLFDDLPFYLLKMLTNKE